MKTFKDFRVELEERNLIATAVDKYREMRDRKAKAENNVTSGDDIDEVGLDKKSLKNQVVSKKKSDQPAPAANEVTEEKEANAENCSDLPPDEKKKERKLDIRKIRAKR